MDKTSVIKSLSIRRSERRASLGELNRDLRIVSGTSTRRLIEAEIESVRGRIDRLSDLIEKREIK